MTAAAELAEQEKALKKLKADKKALEEETPPSSQPSSMDGDAITREKRVKESAEKAEAEKKGWFARG